MKPTKKPHSTGLLVPSDDLTLGEWYAVYGLKADSDRPVQIAGMAFRIVAMNLPFIIGRLATDPANPVTFDSRYLSFMRVSQEYAVEQRAGGGEP